jgi:Flp pilus assembly protein TadG
MNRTAKSTMKLVNSSAHNHHDSPGRGTSNHGHTHDERGSMSLELVMLTPALVAAIMVIAMGARFVDAREDTSSAAFAAARAASLTTNQEAAVAAGRTAARQAMSDRGQSCTRLAVTIDAHAFTPGGTIRATVTCVADLSDLSGFGIAAGHKTFTATAAVPLDQHRDFS